MRFSGGSDSGRTSQAVEEGDAAHRGGRPERRARRDLAEHAAEQRPGDEAGAEGRADQAVGAGPVLGRRDVGHVGEGGGEGGRGDAGDDAAERQPPEVRRDAPSARSRPASPAADSRMTGRRPYWSDSEPMTGEATNCISAHSATKTPLIQPASALEPANSSISAGRTGMMMPIATMSSTAVTRMKAMAALKRPGAMAGHGPALDRERRI